MSVEPDDVELSKTDRAGSGAVVLLVVACFVVFVRTEGFTGQQRVGAIIAFGLGVALVGLCAVAEANARRVAGWLALALLGTFFALGPPGTWTPLIAAMVAYVVTFAWMIRAAWVDEEPLFSFAELVIFLSTAFSTFIILSVLPNGSGS